MNVFLMKSVLRFPQDFISLTVHLKSALAVSVAHQDGHPGSSNNKRVFVVKEIKRNLWRIKPNSWWL